MKADFGTISAVLAFLANGALLAALLRELDDKGLAKLVEDLSSIGDLANRPGEEYVQQKRGDLRRSLFSLPMVALHLAYVGILAGLAAVLLIGPEKLFSAVDGELADPLTALELWLYWAWFALSLLIYLVNGVLPTYRLWRLSRKAGAWLKKYEKPHRRRTAAG